MNSTLSDKVHGFLNSRSVSHSALPRLEKDVTPPGVDPEHQRVRSAAFVLPPDQAFKDAATLAGMAVSVWVRERLRRAARKELEDADKPVAFLGRLSA